MVSWKAVHPRDNIFANWTIEEMRGLMGLQFEHTPEETRAAMTARKPLMDAIRSTSALPESFDARKAFGACSHPIRNQAGCGSCWAFGATETLSDNLCVAKKANVVLSPQDLVSCDSTDHGFKGGTLPNAWKYLVNTGAVADSCLPYTSSNGTVAKCSSMCSSGGTWAKYKCEKSNMLDMEADIKWGVMQTGAAEAGMFVYEDFMHYKSGVYKHDNTTSNMVLGGHALKIVGWGKDAIAGEYWTVANSWGTSWGMSGYFNIALDDMDSGFALGGGFNCGNLAPAPPPPAPPAPPTPTCADLLPHCSQFKAMCAKGGAGECLETCGCCTAYGKPSFCPKK